MSSMSLRRLRGALSRVHIALRACFILTPILPIRILSATSLLFDIEFVISCSSPLFKRVFKSQSLIINVNRNYIEYRFKIFLFLTTLIYSAIPKEKLFYTYVCVCVYVNKICLYSTQVKIDKNKRLGLPVYKIQNCKAWKCILSACRFPFFSFLSLWVNPHKTDKRNSRIVPCVIAFNFAAVVPCLIYFLDTCPCHHFARMFSLSLSRSLSPFLS